MTVTGARGGRTAKHATVARRALVELAPTWRGGGAEWSLLARSLIGIAQAWDDIELEGVPRAVASISARYLDCIGRIVAGCGVPAAAAPSSSGGDDDDGDGESWGDLVGELRAGEMVAEQ
jgi:hypothetical protein